MKNGLITNSYGVKEYWLNDDYHREDGPAVEFENGDVFYYVYGQLHRLDGPAVINGNVQEWWVKGKRILASTQEEFEKMLKLKAFL